VSDGTSANYYIAENILNSIDTPLAVTARDTSFANCFTTQEKLYTGILCYDTDWNCHPRCGRTFDKAYVLLQRITENYVIAANPTYDASSFGWDTFDVKVQRINLSNYSGFYQELEATSWENVTDWISVLGASFISNKYDVIGASSLAREEGSFNILSELNAGMDDKDIIYQYRIVCRSEYHYTIAGGTPVSYTNDGSSVYEVDSTTTAIHQHPIRSASTSTAIPASCRAVFHNVGKTPMPYNCEPISFTTMDTSARESEYFQNGWYNNFPNATKLTVVDDEPILTYTRYTNIAQIQLASECDWVTTVPTSSAVQHFSGGDPYAQLEYSPSVVMNGFSNFGLKNTRYFARVKQLTSANKLTGVDETENRWYYLCFDVNGIATLDSKTYAGNFNGWRETECWFEIINDRSSGNYDDYHDVTKLKNHATYGGIFWIPVLKYTQKLIIDLKMVAHCPNKYDLFQRTYDRKESISLIIEAR
jgi:hypothetical protein